MNKLGFLLGAVAIVVAVFAFQYPLAVPGPQGLQGVPGLNGKDGRDGALGARGLQGLPGKNAEPQLGAITGPDFFFPYLGVNGVEQFYYSQGWNTGTSTVCSFLSPNATSTLQLATIQMNSATATDIQLNWGRGTGNEDYATTTWFDRSATTVPAVVFSNNDTAIDDFFHSVVATTGVDAIDTSDKFASQYRSPRTLPIFPPNERFNVSVAAKNLDTAAAGNGADNFQLTGTCEAVFKTFR